MIGSKWETSWGLELRNIKYDDSYYLHNCHGTCSKAYGILAILFVLETQWVNRLNVG